MDTGGGMMGAAAGKGRTEEPTGRKEGRAYRANGNTLAIEEPTRRTQGLTDSSSATEAGGKGRGLQEKAGRQPPFAEARC